MSLVLMPWLFFVLICMCCCGSAIAATESDKPLKMDLLPLDSIDDQVLKHLVLIVGDTLSLSCRSQGKVGWKADHHNAHHYNISELQEQYVEDNITITNLTITNISHEHVGYFSCFHTEISDGEYETLPQFYVYVKDEDKLLTQDSGVLIHKLRLHQSYVIPCKPTFPEVNINFTLESDSYDPKEGFIITSNGSEDVAKCCGSYGNKSECLHYYLRHNTQDSELDLETFEFLQRPTAKDYLKGKRLKWSVKCGYKNPVFTWKRGGKVLSHTSKRTKRTKRNSYKMMWNEAEGILNISINRPRPTPNYLGNYTLQLEANQGGHKINESLTFGLEVPVSPYISVFSITSENNGMNISLNEEFVLACGSQGYPRPKLVVEFSQCCKKGRCSDYKILSQNATENANAMEYIRSNVSDYDDPNVVIWKGHARAGGLYRCTAENVYGSEQSEEINLLIDGDYPDSGIPNIEVSVNGKELEGQDMQVVEADNITIRCSANRLCHMRNLSLTLDEGPFLQDHMTFDYTTSVSYVSEIKIENVSIERQHLVFNCIDSGDLDLHSNISLQVKPIVAPTWVKSRKPLRNLTMPKMNPISLRCDVDGYPPPVVKWYKDGILLPETNSTDPKVLTVSGSTITFNYSQVNDTGLYRCEASNRAGEIFKEARIIVYDNNILSIILMIMMIVCLIGAFGCLVIDESKTKNEKKCQHWKHDLEQFEKGAPDRLNPDIGLENQAEFLPYIKSWEVPRNRIHLDKIVGQGEFGYVYQAYCKDLVKEEPKTMVAVKTTRNRYDYSHITALSKEMKILMHIGKHVNIVNLMGACSESISTGELLMIVEYCKHGNILTYMKKERKQILLESNADRPTHGFSRKLSMRLKRTSAVFSKDGSFSNDRELESGQTGNAVSPPKMLLSWAFQIACGMEYLASKRVLHGDLAARNILLSDNNVVKISDFGLSRNLSDDANYTKKKGACVPWRWLAPESLLHRIYSTESDVWSFGVVCWEIFSLGQVPYDQEKYYSSTFRKKVGRGLQLQKPPYADDRLFRNMESCWSIDPEERKSFTELKEDFGTRLSIEAKEECLRLNLPYQGKYHSSTLLKSVQIPDYSTRRQSSAFIDNQCQPTNSESPLHANFNRGLPALSVDCKDSEQVDVSYSQKRVDFRNVEKCCLQYLPNGYVKMGNEFLRKGSMVHNINDKIYPDEESNKGYEKPLHPHTDKVMHNYMVMNGNKVISGKDSVEHNINDKIYPDEESNRGYEKPLHPQTDKVMHIYMVMNGNKVISRKDSVEHNINDKIDPVEENNRGYEKPLHPQTDKVMHNYLVMNGNKVICGTPKVSSTSENDTGKVTDGNDSLDSNPRTMMIASCQFQSRNSVHISLKRQSLNIQI